MGQTQDDTSLGCHLVSARPRPVDFGTEASDGFLPAMLSVQKAVPTKESDSCLPSVYSNPQNVASSIYALPIASRKSCVTPTLSTASTKEPLLPIKEELTSVREVFIKYDKANQKILQKMQAEPLKAEELDPTGIMACKLAREAF